MNEQHNKPESEAVAVERRDHGSTLMEVLIAMVLMGTIVSAVVVAMRVMIQTSAFSDDQAGVEAKIFPK